MRFILASQSPRRKEILETIGLPFSVITSHADESYDPSLPPCAIVQTIARQKALTVRDTLRARGEDLTDTVILAADTVVACEGDVLGKPRDREDTLRMLRLLSGRTHAVLSGLCVIRDDHIATDYEETSVAFAPMSEREIHWYADSGEPCDKAGAYAIQGYASLWIDKIDGCYFNVVGLPVSCLRRLLRDTFGLSLSDYLVK